MFLLGLAVPIQAVIVPIFYLMTKAGLYDTLPAVILPTAAFSVPISTIIMTGACATSPPTCTRRWRWTARRAGARSATWCCRCPGGGLATIIVFSALNAWNGFLFPLILTQSTSVRVFTLGLFDFSTDERDRRAGDLRRRGALDHPDPARVPVRPSLR